MISELISDIKKQGIDVWVEEGNLRYKGPKEIITSDILNLLKNNKQEIIHYLKNGDAILKADQKPAYALSSQERSMFFLHQLNPHSIAYNIFKTYKITGSFDYEKIHTCICKLISKHEIFRTSYHFDGEKLYRKIHESVVPKVPVVNASTSELGKVMSSLITPFDLSAAPLIQFQIVVSDEKDYYLTANMPHIIADVISNMLMLDEINNLYFDLDTANSFEYKDYSEWQQLHFKQSVKYKKSEEFWLNEFKGEIPLLELPTDFERPNVQADAGGVTKFKIDSNYTMVITDFAERCNITSFMFVLGTFFIFLKKITSQNTITIGIPVINRNYTGFEKVIGIFLNTLAIKMQVPDELSIHGFFETLKEKLLSCYDNQEYPFEDLVERINLPRVVNRNPLFDFMLSFDSVKYNTEQTGKRIVEEVSVHDVAYNVSKFDLSVHCNESNDTLDFTINYYLALFEKESIEKFAKIHKELIEYILINPEKAIGEIDTVTLKELISAQSIKTRKNDSEIHHGKEKAYVAPHSATEIKIARIWSSILEKKDISINDTFFELGGHSLKVMKFINQVKTEINVGLSITDIFLNPTIKEISGYIDSISNDTEVNTTEKNEADTTLNNSISQYRISQITPTDFTDDIPLSFSQQRLWLLNKISPESTAYNMVSSYIFKGILNLEHLEKAINTIIRQHEGLRTRFKARNGVPYQYIHPFSPIRITCEAMNGENESSFIKQAITEENNHIFDLETGPLFRTRLYRLLNEKYLVIFNMHHIVSDGWSLDIFNRELSKYYNDLALHEEVKPIENPIQYKDFAIWQQQNIQILDKQKSYWSNKLAGPLPVNDFPKDTIVNKHSPEDKNYVIVNLTDELFSQINQFCSDREVSQFMFLLGLFKTLLFKYTGNEDIIIGTPIANRNKIEIENIMGFFMNTLAIRTKISNEQTFLQYLENVKHSALEAFENQDYPFEEIVKEYNPERSLDINPIFQTWFNMVNTEGIKIELNGIEASPVDFDMTETKFNTSFYIYQTSKSYIIQLTYKKDLFSREKISEILWQYKALLRQVLEKPDKKICDYSIQTLYSYRLLPDPGKNFTIAEEKTIVNRIDAITEQLPQKVALVDTHKTWTYSEVTQTVNKVANCLLSCSLKNKDVVAVIAQRNALTVLSVLGIMKSGGTFVIIDADYPTSYIQERLAVTNAKIIINTSAQDKFKKTDQTANWLSLNHQNYSFMLQDFPAEYEQAEVSVDQPSYITFTSGSTGSPKAILNSQRPLSHFIRWYLQQFKFSDTDNFAMLSGLSHDPVLRDMFTPLCAGATLYIPEESMIRSNKLSPWIAEKKITVMHTPPALAKLLTGSSDNVQNHSMQKILFGGDVLTKKVLENCRNVFPNATFYNCYGTSETPQIMSIYEVRQEQINNFHDKIPLGTGIDDVQLLILNQAGQLAGIGEMSEIHVQTPYLSLGYLNDNLKTEEVYISNPFGNDRNVRLYKTGDMGRYLMDGSVEFLGRIDGQLKIRGFRIEPREIELAVMETIKDIKDCAVVAHNDTQLVAFYVSSAEISSLTIKKALKEKLPDYIIPGQYIKIDSIPLTHNRKPDTKALTALIGKSITKQKDIIPPSTDIERELTNIWTSELNTSNISVTDNFFDIGGHSLAVVKVIMKTKEKLGIELSFREFVNSNLREIAKQCESMLVEK